SHGIFEIGRYPGGSDDIVESVCSALQAANIAAFASPDVMAAKYGKLLENLGNVIDAALGSDEARQRLTPRVREEALAVYAAAGIGWRDVTADTPQRRQLMQLA